MEKPRLIVIGNGMAGARLVAQLCERAPDRFHIVLITHDVDEAVLLSDRVMMMTNGPAATVGEILAIDLPRPRNRVQLADDSCYHHLRQQILHFLYEKQPKAA